MNIQIHPTLRQALYILWMFGFFLLLFCCTYLFNSSAVYLLCGLEGPFVHCEQLPTFQVHAHVHRVTTSHTLSCKQQQQTLLDACKNLYTHLTVSLS